MCRLLLFDDTGDGDLNENHEMGLNRIFEPII